MRSRRRPAGRHSRSAAPSRTSSSCSPAPAISSTPRKDWRSSRTAFCRGRSWGVALAGVDVHPCVSQGALPIGPEMAITAADGNVIHELASRPALERLKTAITELDPHERTLAAGGLLLGIVIDENRPDYERGDF